MKTWHTFAFLIAVAVLIHYRAHYLILIVAAMVLFFRGWIWLTWRFPTTMLLINGFIGGLFGVGRRGRWW
ncbi:hypothetical protein ACT4MK_18195 [Bradyrhizobium barranii]|uniref:hypothetical protein n=1 Tax=Bradyrhizobium barranii TaxID=2992140 RepID=UPI00403369C1